MSTNSLSLHSYQRKALDHALNTPRCGLFLDMGLGKTAVVLLALRQLLTDTPEYRAALVVAPKRVVEHTWPAELKKWKEFQDFRVSVIAGTAAQRKAAMQKPAHIYLVSRDNLVWYLEQGHAAIPDILVIDELSSFKNPSAKRFKAIKGKLPRFKRIIGMTGTPTPNGLIDLWSQIYMLDQGERLGRGVTQFRQNYFYDASPAVFPDWRPRNGAHEAITSKLSDICMAMSQADYLALPDLLKVEHPISLPPNLKEAYKAFKRELVLQLNDEPITAANAAVLCGKLLQFCGGRVYDEQHVPQPVHDLKMEALDQLIEEANGQPVLIYYAFTYERDMILDRYQQARDIKEDGAIVDWCNGKVPIMVAHPASAGHGLNLQDGGHIMIWFNLTYDLELYQQACKRLHRMGQSQAVLVHHITLEGCQDSLILNSVLASKAKLADSVIQALKPGA